MIARGGVLGAGTAVDDGEGGEPAVTRGVTGHRRHDHEVPTDRIDDEVGGHRLEGHIASHTRADEGRIALDPLLDARLALLGIAGFDPAPTVIPAVRPSGTK